MPKTMLEFTREGIDHNLDTLRDLLNGVVTCYTTEGLEEFGKSLLETSIYILDRTRERVKSKEDT